MEIGVGLDRNLGFSIEGFRELSRVAARCVPEGGRAAFFARLAELGSSPSLAGIARLIRDRERL